MEENDKSREYCSNDTDVSFMLQSLKDEDKEILTNLYTDLINVLKPKIGHALQLLEEYSFENEGSINQKLYIYRIVTYKVLTIMNNKNISFFIPLDYAKLTALSNSLDHFTGMYNQLQSSERPQAQTKLKMALPETLAKIYTNIRQLGIIEKCMYLSETEQVNKSNQQLSELIKNFNEQCTNSSNKFTETYEKAKDTVSTIKELEETSRKFIEETSKNFAQEHFVKRAKELRTSKRNWLITSFFLSGIAAIIFYFAFIKTTINTSSPLSFTSEIIKRTIYMSFTLLALIFAAKQYSKERILEEKYHFKGITLNSAGMIKEIPQDQKAKDLVNLTILNEVLNSNVISNPENSKENLEYKSILETLVKVAETTSKVK